MSTRTPDECTDRGLHFALKRGYAVKIKRPDGREGYDLTGLGFAFLWHAILEAEGEPTCGKYYSESD